MTMVTERQRRWLTAVLVLGTLVLSIILISLVASIFFAFGDVILVFFLAWLLAFILSPLVARLTRNVPFLRELARSSSSTRRWSVASYWSSSSSPERSPSRSPTSSRPCRRSARISRRSSQPWQDRLDGLGLTQIGWSIRQRASSTTSTDYAVQLAGPLQQLAVASLGAIGERPDRPDPLALHGRRPRRQSCRSSSVSSRRRTRRRRGCSRRASPTRSVGSSAARRSSAWSTRPLQRSPARCSGCRTWR